MFGQQSTTVEFDDFAVTTEPARLKAIVQNPIILWAGFLFIGIIAYQLRLHQVFASFLTKKGNINLHGRVVAIIVINLLVFVVFAEVVALTIYFGRDGVLFYTNKNTYPLITREQEGKLTEVIIHPYFGFATTPGWEIDRNFHTFLWENIEDVNLGTANNEGLFSDHDYPFFKHTSNQYIIGIFGGSVAEEIVHIARDELIKNLKKNSLFADKEIIVLNFASGGYKQPQQLLALNYFLVTGQEFDMVINIDGFNEVVLGNESNRHRVDIAMPQVGAMNGLINLTDQTTLTPRRLESLAKINAQTKKLDDLAITINNNNIASVNFLLEQYYAYIFNNYRQEVTGFEESVSGFSEASLLYVKPIPEVLESSILFERIATEWVTASVMMNQLLNNRNILYFHFLQPNQYYSNKTFTKDEIEKAFDENHLYRQAAETGYPVLITHAFILEENDINFYDSVSIFDDESGTMYRDNCCHYTKQGYDKFAKFIASSILSSEIFNSN